MSRSEYSVVDVVAYVDGRDEFQEVEQDIDIDPGYDADFAARFGHAAPLAATPVAPASASAEDVEYRADFEARFGRQAAV